MPFRRELGQLLLLGLVAGCTVEDAHPAIRDVGDANGGDTTPEAGSDVDSAGDVDVEAGPDSNPDVGEAESGTDATEDSANDAEDSPDEAEDATQDVEAGHDAAEAGSDAADDQPDTQALDYPIPAAHYTFDDADIAGGTLRDNVGSHDGVIYGTVSIPGPVAEAMRFDGVDDYVELPPFGWLGSTLTLAVWARVYKTPPNNANPAFFDQWDFTTNRRAVLLGVGNPGKYLTAISTDGVGFVAHSDPTPILLGEWTHIVATYDGSRLSLYRNGEERGNVPASGSIFQINLPIWLGRSRADSQPQIIKDSWLFGDLDELAVWDVALTASEIGSVYQRGVDGVSLVP